MAMETSEIIAAIDAEIQRLQHARTLLSGDAVVKRGPGGAKGFSTAPKRRQISSEGRAKIAAAQRARWAKAKKAAK
jgi:hypothetical protein